MTLKEAILSHKYVTRPNSSVSFCYFEEGTGPYSKEGSGLVDCDYFVIVEDGVKGFSTSIDLYAEEILATDYIFDDSLNN